MKKILVIEDEKELSRNLALLLQAQDYMVMTAGNGIEGLKDVKEFEPDLIICDIMMPKMDGYDVIRELNKQSSIIPFIFLTARAERDDWRKGMELGADDYIIKPFSNKELIKAIEARLNKFDLLKAKQSSDKYQPEKKYSPEDEILFELSNSSVLVKVKKIKLIKILGHFSQLTLENNKHVLQRRSITQWEEVLPGDIFVRIHRSAIINISYISQIEKLPTRLHQVVLKNSEKRINISRNYYNTLKERFK